MSDWLQAPYPTGDAQTLFDAASALKNQAAELVSLQGSFESAVFVASGGWTGHSALAFEAATKTTDSQLRQVTPVHGEVAGALIYYADALFQAQSDSDRARGNMERALDDYEYAGRNAATDVRHFLSRFPGTGKIADWLAGELDAWAPPSWVTIDRDTSGNTPDYGSAAQVEVELTKETGWGLAPIVRKAARTFEWMPFFKQLENDVLVAVDSHFADAIYQARRGACDATSTAQQAAGSLVSELDDRARQLLSPFSTDHGYTERDSITVANALGVVVDPSAREKLQPLLDKLLNTPGAFTSDDIDAFLAVYQSLPPDQQARLLADLAQGDLLADLLVAIQNDTDPARAQGILTTILQGMSPGDVAKLAPEPDDSYWSPAPPYVPVTGPLFGPGGPHESDFSQGGLPDCWFLSSLMSVVEQDPDFIKNHIHSNGNGTTTVDLYVDGKEVPVTVTNSIPEDIGGPVSATDKQGTWAELYEKAYAQLQGGYGKIAWGHGDVGLAAITGQSASRAKPGTVSFSQLQGLFEKGTPITVGIAANGNDSSDHGGTLIGAHEYSVQSVNSDGTVTLRNPWDPNDCPRLKWSDIQGQANEVCYTPGPA